MSIDLHVPAAVYVWR